jgi:hypothetical protein
MDNIMTNAQKRERHRAWLESFGLSAEDWRRLHDAAARVLGGEMVPALRDLSVPLHVAVLLHNPRYPLRPGEILGVITGPEGQKVMLTFSRLDDPYSHSEWEKRRAAWEARASTPAPSAGRRAARHG